MILRVISLISDESAAAAAFRYNIRSGRRYHDACHGHSRAPLSASSAAMHHASIDFSLF